MRRIITAILLIFSVNTIHAQITITPIWVYGGCAGSCQGAAVYTISGGTAPYTYTLSPSLPMYTYTTGYVSIPNVCPGSYTLITSDQNSLIASVTFSIIQSSPVSAIITTTNSNCGTPCNGAIDISGVGGIPPYSYSYITSAPFPVTMPMNNLCSGTYSFNISDSNGCTTSSLVPVMANTTLSGLNVTSTVVDATCINTHDGSIHLNLSGTNPGPFTYQWSNGATVQNMNNINPNTYMVTIYDAGMNCMSFLDTVKSINGNCGFITGNIYMDNNTDCIKNSGDVNCSTAGVIVMPGNRIGYTDLQGNYYIDKVPYGTYTITPDNYANSVLGTCATSIVTTINSSAISSLGNDFPMGYTSLTQPDAQVYATTNGIVPGFNCYINYSLCNLNNVSANGTYKAVLPPGFVSNIISVIPNSYTLSGDTVIWNFSNLTNTTNCLTFVVHFTVPVSTPLGSTFTTCMIAQSSITDFDITNNENCYDRIVTGAFDPNDKSVSPLGIGPNGNISTDDKELTYLIRFQNTGNGPANTVSITDTISSYLDITTFQMLGADHTYDVEFAAGNIIKWTFNNIMLPDSNSNEPGSHGYLQYRIKQKPGNTPGTQIKNTAYIYFDYNAPVVTNTTLNTIDISTSVFDKQKNVSECILYPNTTTGLIAVRSSKEMKQIEVINVAGQLLLSEPVNQTSHQVQLQNFAEGIYFVKVMYANGMSVTKKVVKQ